MAQLHPDVTTTPERRKPTWLALWAATVVAAAWLGHAWGEAPPPPSPASARACPPVAFGATAAPAGLAADEARAIVHDELARQLAELRSGAAPPATPEPAALDQVAPADPAAALPAAALPAAALIDRAVAAGHWTADDRRAFAQASAALPPPLQIELQRKLHVAINRGQIALADGAPPFGPPQ